MKTLIQYPDVVYFPRKFTLFKCSRWAEERGFSPFCVTSNGDQYVLLYDTTKWYQT
jgi:hypothetical protein